MSEPALRVLFAAAECAPLVKVGGLGDVSAALPRALREAGVDVRVLLPGYRAVIDAIGRRRAGRIPSIPGIAGTGATRLVEADLPDGVPLIVIDNPSLFDRPGGPYQDPQGVDWPDNPLRFGLLSKVAALLATDATPLAWRPDVLHCNDWHTALAAAFLRHAGPQARDCATVQTVHNLAYQGSFAPEWVARLGLPSSSHAPQGLAFHDGMSFLEAGLRFADAITTVSPTYAREILTVGKGCGLEGLLRAREPMLFGILNGIDTAVWNPAQDRAIAQRYDRSSLESKAVNKAALQAAMGLERSPGVPLLAVISRLVAQKGIDLVADIGARLTRLPAQLAVLGMGDAELEGRLRQLAAGQPGAIAVHVGFDEALAHRIEAGADALLMPSRFEPCGLNQMYSQRYGTLPIVHGTGGLADTVVDCTPGTLAAGTATGFVLGEASAVALYQAIERATVAYRDPALWRALQANAMARDFGWAGAARRYLDVYVAALDEATGRRPAGMP